MSQVRLIGGRFEIADPERDLLGRGGMGDVYRGRDLQTGQAVAIKALRPEVVANDPNALVRFQREGEALRQLDHHNIVKMVDGVEQERRHYLVMEYVPGGSLRDLLEEKGRLPIERTVEIALDVADALTRAHRLGIVHRDLKPSNVLLAEDGTPRLTDFGVAHLATAPRLTRTGTVLGTVLYLSPEACRGETLDARTDIWAFGVMLYEMLSGQVPFGGETFPAVFMAILSQSVPDLLQARPDVSDALADLVYRMLEKERGQRIPSVRQVGLELEAVSEGYELRVPGPLKVGSSRHELGIASRERPPIAESRFATPTPSITEAPKHNLPVQPTPFVGREAELAELDGLLSDPDVRLVTVLGVGGIGKTRLALEAAARRLDHYPHGVYWVPLAPLRSAEAIVPAIASALGFQFYEAGTPHQQLLDYLREKHMLLLLDNYEHLLACPERGRRDGGGAAVEIVVDVVAAAPRVKLLATSRARLNVRGEHRFHISGMEFPDWETAQDALGYSAVKLLMQSARRARPGFELGVDDLQYVARICRLVQGMPLAILLAAAWVDVLSLGEIAAEIERSLDFLEGDLRDVPARQRSVRAVCDHSWNLLSEGERAAYEALSVFRGGFTRHAAQQVTDVTLRELMALVNKSLLHRTPRGRYEVHELLRQYAAEKLDQSPDAGETVRDRHCAYYVAALQGWETDLRGPRQMTALAEMDVEIDNARAAWDWAAERGYVERLDRAMDGLLRFYGWRARWQERESACQRAAERLSAMACKHEPGHPHVTARGARLRVLVKLWAEQSGRLGGDDRLLHQGMSLLEGPELASQDTRAEKAFLSRRMAFKVSFSDNQECKRLLERSLALYEDLGDRWEMANTLQALARTAWLESDYAEMSRRCRESLAIYESLGDRLGISGALWYFSAAALNLGEADKAEHLARESLAIAEELGARGAVPDRLMTLALALSLSGKYAEAHSLLGEALAIATDLGSRVTGDLYIPEYQSQMDMERGLYEQARAQAERALEVAREYRSWRNIGWTLRVLGSLALAEGAHAEAQRLLQESIAAYRECGKRDELGWALACAGLAARGLGEPAQARRHLGEALRMGVETGGFGALITALPATALLLADGGEPERSVELYALASRHPSVACSRWFEDVAGREVAAAAAALSPEVVAAAQERGRARDLRATAEELLAELEEQ